MNRFTIITNIRSTMYVVLDTDIKIYKTLVQYFPDITYSMI